MIGSLSLPWNPAVFTQISSSKSTVLRQWSEPSLTLYTADLAQVSTVPCGDIPAELIYTFYRIYDICRCHTWSQLSLSASKTFTLTIYVQSAHTLTRVPTHEQRYLPVANYYEPDSKVHHI